MELGLVFKYISDKAAHAQDQGVKSQELNNKYSPLLNKLWTNLLYLQLWLVMAGP